MTHLTCCLGLRVFVLLLLHTNECFPLYLGFFFTLKVWRGLERVTKTGPNDMSGVVWAIGLSLFCLLTICSYYKQVFVAFWRYGWGLYTEPLIPIGFQLDSLRLRFGWYSSQFFFSVWSESNRVGIKSWGGFIGGNRDSDSIYIRAIYICRIMYTCILLKIESFIVVTHTHVTPYDCKQICSQLPNNISLQIRLIGLMWLDCSNDYSDSDRILSESE